MLNRKERLRLLELERTKQIEKIRNIESNMIQLFDKEQSIKRQMYQGELLRVEIQEEILLNQVVRQLSILEQIDVNMEILYADL